MPVKVFNVCVELDVLAVTCPGVWLCPKGKIILKLNMFGNSARTSRLSPIFPLLYCQKLIFQKTFPNARYLTDLQHLLGKEFIHAELIQCSDGGGVILALFETTVFELLYSSPCVKSLIAGVDVDLLMVPTRYFPGTLGPKIRVSTNTMIEEIVDTSPSHKSNPGLVSPKMLSSKYISDAKRCHQGKVCHGKHQLCKSPELRKKPLHSKRVCCKQSHSSVPVVPSSSDCSTKCTCGCCQAETNGVRAQTMQDIPTQLPFWTTVSGREYSPCSCCKTVKESALGKEEHMSKWRHTGKDHYKNCHCCKYDESHMHKACNCPVCCTYKVYFGTHCADGCPAEQARKPCTHACSMSKKCKQSELHSLWDRYCSTSDEVSSEQKQVLCYGKSQYREEFYHDLEKFYRKLHKWGKQGASEGV